MKNKSISQMTTKLCAINCCVAFVFLKILKAYHVEFHDFKQQKW